MSLKKKIFALKKEEEPWLPVSLALQSTLDKWNLHGTERNGSTYRMLNLSRVDRISNSRYHNFCLLSKAEVSEMTF